MPVAVLVALLLVAHAAWWVHRAGLRVGLANALVDVVAYPFRIAWLAAAARRRGSRRRPGGDGLPPGGARC